MLEKSFEHVRTVMKDVPDADLDKKVSFFGHEMTERAVFMPLLGHLNEHMGQEVAYARVQRRRSPLVEDRRALIADARLVSPATVQAIAPTCR